MDSEVDKGKVTKNILKEKKRTIQLLKNKLKILTTHLIQASELIELEKEKELLSHELNDYKENLLNIIEEHNQWERKEVSLIQILMS